MNTLPTEYGLDQVQEFLSDAINTIGLGFHPDTLMWDYSNKDGALFNDTLAKNWQRSLDRAYEWCEDNGFDICALAMQSPEYQALISNIEDLGQ